MEFYILIGKGFNLACWLFDVKEVGEIDARRIRERERERERERKEKDVERKTIPLVSFDVFHVPEFSTCNF